jgi:hypothetical protein
MFARWVDYLCPHCGRVTGRSVIKRLRLGPEYKSCPHCFQEYRTSEYEWAHLSQRRRFEYFFTEDLVGILIAFPFFGALTGGLVSEGNASVGAVIGFFWGLVLASPWIAIAWYRRVRLIKQSLKRCPEDASSPIEPSSLLPWRRKY